MLFQKIGVMARQHRDDIQETLIQIIDDLLEKKLIVILDQDTATYLGSKAENLTIYHRDILAQYCNLIIVVGGDGSLLNAAHAAVKYQTPVVGINRGRLGFLTDIRPQEATHKLAEILKGNYIEEKRFLLTAKIIYPEDATQTYQALNDIVLMPGDAPHMIEFSTYINQEFMCAQYADGLIIATPTGSTAYALSGGGPILHPRLNAVVLVPMFPHTLSARPIVVSADSQIEIHIISQANISCDGQKRILLPAQTKISIQKEKEHLHLIHPKEYNYFETLRTKLHWG